MGAGETHLPGCPPLCEVMGVACGSNAWWPLSQRVRSVVGAWGPPELPGGEPHARDPWGLLPSGPSGGWAAVLLPDSHRGPSPWNSLRVHMVAVLPPSTLTSKAFTARDNTGGLAPRRVKSRFSMAFPSLSRTAVASRASLGSKEAAAASAFSRTLRASSMRLCRRPTKRGDCGDSRNRVRQSPCPGV